MKINTVGILTVFILDTGKKVHILWPTVKTQSISSESALFAKINSIFRDRIHCMHFTGIEILKDNSYKFYTFRINMYGVIVCLFGLILYVPSTIFQLYRDGSSWIEPVLS